ncbi:putative glutathione S-transferase 5 [Holothuria leucospilota]|uniref:Glutathione S-transferase 5 n=1 Tax=Holothuria leucospilota TaxID=206669 RepID=A0A9Q1BER2_HOLLE|nr:putative glutathione S-transferase 5 [Holothuria leucospilota]
MVQVWIFAIPNQLKMSTYKLIYFNGKGRAETARFMFAVAGQKYEDYRIPSDKWPEVKKTLLFGQVPALEVDGEQLTQSCAINRFLARKLNLYGDSDMEAAKIDQVCEALVDLGLVLRECLHETDETRKAALLKELLETKSKRHFASLVKLLELNNGGDGFFVGNRVSLADLDAATYFLDMVTRVPGLKLTEPKLLAHLERIKAIPALAEWLKNRPESPF